MTGKRIHMAWFSGHGAGPSGWDDPAMPAGYRWDRPELYVDSAKIMDRAGFDAIVFADTMAIPDTYQGRMDAYLEHAIAMPKLDPAVLTPMIAAETSSIGVVATLTTTFYPPYLLARLTATLDHVTEGRSGWNVVTAFTERAAQNFGMDRLPEHDTRYDIADDYLALCQQLWNTWDADAVVMDRAAGRFADPSKVHRMAHRGPYFTAEGTLNVVPSPQHRPYILQAGSSDRGIRFAGEHADLVIATKHTPAQMREFRDRVRARAAECGRNPDDVKVLFIVTPLFAHSEDALRSRRDALLPRDPVAVGLATLSVGFDHDLSAEPLDEPPSAERLGPAAERFRLPDGSMPTLRQAAERQAGWTALPLEGTPEAIATRMEEVVEESGCDGFAIRGRWIPEYVHDVSHGLMAALRARGRVLPPTSGATLRERMAMSIS
jgi:FMN-dependent oxidoreductase (nitrilotriacetate monooxygenase family)